MSAMAVSFALHMIGLVIWLGAGTLFPIAILPALQEIDETSRTKFINVITKRFVPYFIASGIVVGLTGGYQTIQMVDDLNIPAIITKHIAILPLILASIYFWLYLARKLSKPETTTSNIWNQFVICSWVQGILGIVVLILTGWLTS